MHSYEKNLKIYTYFYIKRPITIKLTSTIDGSTKSYTIPFDTDLRVAELKSRIYALTTLPPDS